MHRFPFQGGFEAYFFFWLHSRVLILFSSSFSVFTKGIFRIYYFFFIKQNPYKDSIISNLHEKEFRKNSVFHYAVLGHYASIEDKLEG